MSKPCKNFLHRKGLRQLERPAMTQPTTGEAHICAANITTLLFNDYGYDFRGETLRQIEWLVDRDTGLPALKAERDAFQKLANDLDKSGNIVWQQLRDERGALKDRVAELEGALRSCNQCTCEVGTVNWSRGGIIPPHATYCHSTIAVKALANPKEA